MTHASYCGSLRRFSETIGDVDIVVAATAAEPVMEALVGMKVVERVLVRGEAKTSVVTHRGTQVDVRVVAAHQLGAARLYFTGSKGHNIKLRQRALARGLDAQRIRPLGDRGGQSDRERDRGADLRGARPRLHSSGLARRRRRDRSGRDAHAAAADRRPIIGDFHVHTTVSGDGRSSLEEVVAAAKARGHRVLAITDHAEGTLSGVGREALLDQRAKIRAMQAELGDSLTLMHGVELNIGPAGELDYDPEFRQSFDWCLASVHDHFELDRAAQTKRIVTAMQDPSGAHDRASFGSHDRRPPSDRSRPRRRFSPPRKRPTPPSK